MRSVIPFAIDSYKGGHYLMYPNDVEKLYAYMESRKNGPIVVFGLQYFLKELEKPIEKDSVKEVFEIAKIHGIPYPYEELMKLADLGYLPIEIKAVPEGSIMPNRVPLLTVENTEKEFFWLPTFIETFLLKAWYTFSITTEVYKFREVLEEYGKNTDEDISFVDFQLHNFGDRGSVGIEGAILGGMAHLTCFKGTDNFFSLKKVSEIYGDSYEEIGFSVPATEHSVALAWGNEKELEYVKHVLEVNKDYPIVSIVMDTYNIYKLVDMVTKDEEIRRMLEENGQKLVIRPDSGDHEEVLSKILYIIEKNEWPYVLNEKGYKVLQNLGIIWGDGVNYDTIKKCLDVMINNEYSVSNIVFGCGGFLMQNVNRDTFGFSYKVSEVTIKGKGIPVCKQPVTSSFKKTLAGRVITALNTETGYYETVLEGDIKEYHEDVMNIVFKNGSIKKKFSLNEIRNNLIIMKYRFE